MRKRKEKKQQGRKKAKKMKTRGKQKGVREIMIEDGAATRQHEKKEHTHAEKRKFFGTLFFTEERFLLQDHFSCWETKRTLTNFTPLTTIEYVKWSAHAHMIARSASRHNLHAVTKLKKSPMALIEVAVDSVRSICSRQNTFSIFYQFILKQH